NSLKLIGECDLTWLHIFPYSPRAGTPAERMPQVNKTIIKKRASTLRTAGDAQVQKHLNAAIGEKHAILIETPRIGRTEQFSEVMFDIDQIEGQIINRKIIGLKGTRLQA
ncbi:MAG: tRNA (N(6)-L-threonylcarbamoyladenosine(37)-C(2))-methylthiotransferase MtaB, partial [Proteobacteria bacterium]|nr:tRNA (N(6)-L-threonylcarbamoyladenosine(37)-C(2))-methylthiotransferase MtaB [Pseudomonadota bacterium]